MNVVIAAATLPEVERCMQNIDALYTGVGKRLKITFHITGVGMLASAVSLTKLMLEERPDLVIQSGVAGCFDITVPLASVVVVKEEMLGDTGVEEDNEWKDIFDLKLHASNFPPFEKRKLLNPWLADYNLCELPEVDAVTVNEITTKTARIKQLIKKYAPVIETMEGAALHYIARLQNVAFIQVRAISNYVGERDKTKWLMKEAILNLNDHLLEYADKLYHLK